MAEDTVESIEVAKEPPRWFKDQTGAITWSVEAHLKNVADFFGAGDAYQDQEDEFETEFGLLQKRIEERLEAAESLAMTGNQRESLAFIDNMEEEQRILVTAAELLTSSDPIRTLTNIDWSNLDFRPPDRSLKGKIRRTWTIEGFKIGKRRITGDRLRMINEDPVARTRFYLTVAAAKKRELPNISSEELFRALVSEKSLTELRLENLRRGYPLPEGASQPITPKISPEIRITGEDLPPES